MSELNNQVEPTQESPDNNSQEPQQSEELTIEQQINAAVQAAEDRIAKTFKADIDGLNRRNSLLENQKSELEKKFKEMSQTHMSEEERAKAELAELKEAVELERREKSRLARERLVDKALSTAGLPLEFQGRILGETEEEIVEDIERLKAYFEEQVKIVSDKQVNEKFANKPPKTGGTNTEGQTMTRADFEQLSPEQKLQVVKSGANITDT